MFAYFKKINKSFLIAFFLILIFTLGMFYDVLFSPGEFIISARDLTGQFLFWRKFGFDELRKGNVPLWCPYVFSGMPFMGWWQSAIFYPLNLIYLILPLSRAINYSIAIHVFLGGLFMYFWASQRKLNLWSSIFSSLLFMFCSSHFLRIYAGHLSVLCTIIWVPLLFFSVDGFLETHSPRWTFLGIFTIAMQILAGHPQYVFYTFVTVVIYCAFCLHITDRKILLILWIILIYSGGALLSSVQLLTGIDCVGESLRSNGMSYKFASDFAFPPENFITLLAPDFFGDMVKCPYWGRSFLWESSCFISITGLILAIYGFIYSERKTGRFSLYMILILFLFALGKYTPLFYILYNFVPEFNKFRGIGKFIFFASVFLIILAAAGADSIIRGAKIGRNMVIFLFLTAIFLFAAGHWISYSSNGLLRDGLWVKTIKLMKHSDVDNEFIKHTGDFAAKSLFKSSLIVAIVAFLFLLSPLSRKIAYLILIAGIIEIFLFASNARVTFKYISPEDVPLQNFLETNSGDYRILLPENPNFAMFIGAQNIWGYDSNTMKRYSEFLAFVGGYDIDTYDGTAISSRNSSLYAMIRCKYIFHPRNGETEVEEIKNPMSRLELIDDYVVIKERNDIFNEMGKSSFNPKKKVILEKEPYIKPVKTKERGFAKVIDCSINYLTVEADLSSPAILLVTDIYSKNWHARPLPGSSQKQYDVMPGDYILRAIPLDAGYHKFRLEYLPLSYQIGKIISIISCLIYIFLLLWFFIIKPSAISSQLLGKLYNKCR